MDREEWVSLQDRFDTLMVALWQIAELEGDCEDQKFKLTRFQTAQLARKAINETKERD